MRQFCELSIRISISRGEQLIDEQLIREGKRRDDWRRRERRKRN